MARIAFWRLDDSEAVQARRRKSWGTPGARWSAIGQRDVLSATGLRVVSYAKRNFVTRGVTILVADLAQQSAEMARRDERMIAAHKMPRIVLCRQDGPGSSWHVCGLPGPRQAAWAGFYGRWRKKKAAASEPRLRGVRLQAVLVDRQPCRASAGGTDALGVARRLERLQSLENPALIMALVIAGPSLESAGKERSDCVRRRLPRGIVKRVAKNFFGF
ncbi:MAG: hypothetical protein KatS3mg038_3155 [Candidatus Kapaibacterium sp.]|nr:MAG: hypothetical protein KatS3mg038_1932 [Candidatus Kapabacteria bacterium]GIV52634.1 MAG: hypothetical protein KatS3mg038_3155 [Candidatus Kapabacteria bacterium]